MRAAWLYAACFGLALSSCEQAPNPGAPSGSSSAQTAAASPSGFGGWKAPPAPSAPFKQPSAAFKQPSAAPAPSLATASAPTSAAPTSAAPSEPVVIPRSPVPTALTLAPPKAVHGIPRGPINTALDGAWLRRMSHLAISAARENKGGSTVTIRLAFEDGARAVLKAQQVRSATNYKSEIAAYHIDRLLGFARTAPVVGRTFPRGLLREQLAQSGASAEFLKRFDEELVSKEGSPGELRGAVIAWHERPLRSLAVPRNWPKWLAGQPAAAPEPFKAHLSALSELSVFDYLLDNTDRWSGGNVLLLGDAGPMVFLDNGAGFADWRMQRGLALNEDLERVCSFPLGIVRSLRRVGPEAKPARRLGALLGRSLKRDPLSPVLSEAHLSAVDLRVEQLLKHFEQCPKPDSAP